MWPVSERFLDALRYPHRRRTTVTVTPPGGDPIDVELKSGTVTVAGGKGVRRRANLSLVGDTTRFSDLAAPGALWRIDHGLVYGATDELVPVFTGELVTAAQEFGSGGITVSLADLGNWLSRCAFVSPFQAAAVTRRVDAIEEVVFLARTSTTFENTSTDLGAVGSAQMWTTNPHDVIDQLTKDGGTEAFFKPDGTFLIRNRPTTTTTSVWTGSGGSVGVISTAARTRPLDRMFNTVVVQPATTDGSQTWSQTAVYLNDSTHPRNVANIGPAPYFFKSPTAQSSTEAGLIAREILDQVIGTTETLALQVVANPALEANEPIRVVTAPMPGEPAATFQHFVDSFTLDLVTGGMRLDTRSQGVVVDA